jgi:hypothetical protein
MKTVTIMADHLAFCKVWLPLPLQPAARAAIPVP